MSKKKFLPDELELANQVGYEEGLCRGETNGLQRAATIIETWAARDFIDGKDDKASYLRRVAMCIRDQVTVQHEQELKS